MAQDEPIEELIRDFKTGRNPEKSFREIFNLYYAQVCRFFFRRGFAQEDSRDLAQDVFFSVYQGLANIQNSAHFQGWMFTIARNILVNELEKRHAKKREGLHVSPTGELGEQDMDVLPSREPGNALQSMLDSERTQKLAHAMNDLPAQMRRCVQLRVTSDCTYEEIAAIMGISVNTVKAHLHKARKSLQQKLSSYFEGSTILGREDG